MRVLFLGNNDLAVACLKRILLLKEDIVGIVVNHGIPARDFFLKMITGLAKKNKITIYCPRKINDPLFLNQIRDLKLDLIISVSYRQILKREILGIPRVGAVNLHPSYLPKYRGKNPLNWVLINGEKETGVTVHYINEGIDAGGILARKKIKIFQGDTAGSLQKKFVQAAPDLIERTIGLIRNGRARAIPQNEKEASYYPPRTAEDGKINWDRSAKDIYNLIRALIPPSYPGAFTYLPTGGKIVFRKAIFPSILSILKANGSPHKPGEVIDVKKGKVLIQTGRGILRVNQVDIEIKPNPPLKGLRKGILFKDENSSNGGY